MKEITVTIITKNEEKNIENAIKSAQKLGGEIVVVDSNSTDSTVVIAKKLGAKVFVNKFTNFANQKNYAVSKAIGRWIFSLDADEEITDQLAKEINEKIKSDRFNAYLVPRRNFILGGEIKHARWSPDRHVWLWKRGFGKWVGEVHEEVEVEGELGILTNAKLHYQDETIAEFLDMTNRYTTIEAQRKYKKGERFSLRLFLYYPVRSFIGRYFYKQGYKDGWRGFVICVLRAFYHAIVYLKLLELAKKS